MRYACTECGCFVEDVHGTWRHLDHRVTCDPDALERHRKRPQPTLFGASA